MTTKEDRAYFEGVRAGYESAYYHALEDVATAADETPADWYSRLEDFFYYELPKWCNAKDKTVDCHPPRYRRKKPVSYFGRLTSR